MRWQAPKIGERRIIKRFLILPRHINGIYRWLEHAKIEQYVVTKYLNGYYYQDWEDLKWIDEQ